jgi:nitrogen fixation/metabolism regulation signal transduction histidine kinase
VKLFGNPIFLRMGLLLFAGVFAYCMGAIMVRRMRRSLLEEAAGLETPAPRELFPLQTYNAVIQQLKQQKHELLSEQQAERRRAKTSESISAAVLSHLSSGVLFVTPNAIVRQANAAARQILGFASPAGMSLAELFREATLVSATGWNANLAQSIAACLGENIPFRNLEAKYVTPAGEQRLLEITVSSVSAPSGDVVGAACLINDKTEVVMIRRQQELRGEMSAEMALELRTSLNTISGYARQLAANCDPDLARQLAADIASEAAQLDRTIGGFLAGASARSTAVEALLD